MQDLMKGHIIAVITNIKRKNLRALLLFLAMLLGVITTQNTVQAGGMGGPNTGDYVYEDREYVTNGQYDQLENINDNIDTGVNPQKLYIIIFDNADDEHIFAKKTGTYLDSANNEARIVDNTGWALYGFNDFYDMELDNEDLTLANNYLIMDMRNNMVYLNPSLSGCLYLTDLMFMKMRWGLNSELNSTDPNVRVAALFKLVQKLEPKMLDVSRTNKMLKSTDISDVKQVINYLELIGSALLIIIILLIIHKRNKNKPHHGSGPDEPGNSEYDAGFDEGYYMGSNDSFM